MAIGLSSRQRRREGRSEQTPAAHQGRSRGARVERGLNSACSMARPAQHRAQHSADIGGSVGAHGGDGGNRKARLAGSVMTVNRRTGTSCASPTAATMCDSTSTAIAPVFK